jgi:hypothetical protein
MEYLKKYKIILTALIVIIVAIIGFAYKITNPDSNEKIIYKYEVKTIYGDTFIVSNIENIFYSDPIFYNIDVKKSYFKSKTILSWDYNYQSPGNKSYDELKESDIFFKDLSFNCIYDSPIIRCYELTPTQPQKSVNKSLSIYDIDLLTDGLLLYKIKKTEHFRIKQYGFFNTIEQGDNIDLELLPIIKSKFSTGEWHWVKIFAKYLIKTKDQNAILTMKRYSSGNFTKEEISINKDEITPSEMQKFAQKIINENKSNLKL